MKKTVCKRKSGVSFIVLVICVVFSALPIYAKSKMPSFSLENVLDGKHVDSASYDDKVLLVTFFATWCPPCRMEVDELKELQAAYHEKGFSVVALSVDQEGSEKVADFIRSEKINYPVLMATMETSRDFGGVYGIPTAFLVNKKGDVVKRYQGFVDQRVFVKDIQSVLE